MPYDLFISYSRRDNAQGRITQLVERIKTDFAPFAKRELVPFFDQQEIAGMQDWRQRILQGLRESRLLHACLSPAYLKSEYCEWEFVEYLKYEIGHLHGFNGVAPIYFVEVPGWEGKVFEQRGAAWIAELRKRQHFDLRPWHDQGEEALRDVAVQERMGKLNRRIVQTITRGERAEKSLGNVDAHNPHFIGRTANLRMLRENFVKPGHIGVVTAVNGVGGLGKTALAIEYAHAFADEYGGGRWQVRCAGKDDLRLALAELATPIGFEFTDDEKKNADLQFERTRRKLKKLSDARAPHRCLLLLDNVDRPGLLDPAQVARLNGGDWLHVLATTRLGENELHGAHRDRSFLAIDELPPDDALALIESYQPDGLFRSEAERDAAREIVRLLGSFTLAVESAAVYLGQFANDVTCAAFLARLKKEGMEGLDTAVADEKLTVRHGEKRLSATLQPTLERLGAVEKLALEFAALLPPDQVPLPWLRALVAKTFPEMERDAEPGYPDPWKNVLRRLFGLRLVQATDVVDTDGQPRVVRVHRVVQKIVLLDQEIQQNTIIRQILSLAKSRCEFLQQAWIAPENRWEILPIVACAEGWIAEQREDGAFVANQIGVVHLHIGEYAAAENLFVLAADLVKKTSGEWHFNYATCLNNIADLLLRKKDYVAARSKFEQVLSLYIGNLGENHPFVATACVNLSRVHLELGNIDDAEAACKVALEIDEEHYGSEHPEIATDLMALAHILQKRGKLDEAEQTYRRVLEIYQRSLSSDHPQIAVALNNLASFLSVNKRPDDAEILSRQALEIDRRCFGSDHANLVIRLNNLAQILRAKGRLKEALGPAQEALQILVAASVKDVVPHPDLGNAANTLATLATEAGLPEPLALHSVNQLLEPIQKSLSKRSTPPPNAS